MKIEIDASEVRQLAEDMRHVEPKLARHLKPAVMKGAVNVRGIMQGDAEGSRHFRIAKTISFDVIDGGYCAEIGPVKGGAGSLANIAYFGGANGGGGTIRDPKHALEEEAPRFQKALADLAEELTLG